jgi:hypothetical protein
MSILTEAVCKCGKEFLSAKWETLCWECRQAEWIKERDRQIAELGEKRKPVLYTCGPIDGVTPEWATDWRRLVKDSLPTWTVLDPTEGKDLHAIGVNDSLYTPDEIVEADLAMVKRADVILMDWRKLDDGQLVAIINKYIDGESDYLDMPLGVGTICELWEAHRTGKQVVSFGTLRCGYWKRRATDKHFDTLTEAIEYLKGEAE